MANNIKRFALVGDVHAFGGRSGFQNMCTDYVQINKPLDHVFIVGDLTYDALEEEYSVVAQWADKWPAIVSMVMGNHDMKNKWLDNIEERATLKQRFLTICKQSACNYTITIGNNVFIFISTDATTVDEKLILNPEGDTHYAGDGTMTAETKAFFINALSTNQDKNVFVCSHQPPYDIGQWATERASNTYYNKAEMQTLLTTYRVDVWFYGHCHQAYKNGVVDISAPYTGTPPEFKSVDTRNAKPSAVTNGSNTTVFVPCWGGNKFYGSRLYESRYFELQNGSNQISIRARDHDRGIWQERVPNLTYTCTLPNVCTF